MLALESELGLADKTMNVIKDPIMPNILSFQCIKIIGV